MITIFFPLGWDMLEVFAWCKERGYLFDERNTNKGLLNTLAVYNEKMDNFKKRFQEAEQLELALQFAKVRISFLEEKLEKACGYNQSLNCACTKFKRENIQLKTAHKIVADQLARMGKK